MDGFVTCPYNPLHRVPRCRIQRHLIKCEKTGPKLHICPYNATHRFTEAELKIHIKNCPSQKPFLLEDVQERTVILTTPVILKRGDYVKPEDDFEDWDD